jgi:hypothetical protein
MYGHNAECVFLHWHVNLIGLGIVGKHVHSYGSVSFPLANVLIVNGSVVWFVYACVLMSSVPSVESEVLNHKHSKSNVRHIVQI